MNKLLSFIVFCISLSANAQSILPAAHSTHTYLPFIQGKNIAVFANQTSTINSTHLVDTLLKMGVSVKAIFGPEHGFRGEADAGEKIKSGIDTKTNVPVISLYGNHKKPTKEDLKNIDAVLFDIQDVGVRFYTYISSLQYVIEACAEEGVQLIILDRPNPNGFYIDGPVLNRSFTSFVGMQPIPIVYGMTIGEYALMLAGEDWLAGEAKNIYKKAYSNNQIDALLKIIPCTGYDHSMKYILPIHPSPNLKDMRSVYWYPSTCFFEGTLISEGRGTDLPFVKFGHPALASKTLFSFTPLPNEGAKSGKLFGQKCFGYTLENIPAKDCIDLSYFIKVYQQFPDKKSFFLQNNFIDKLAGTDQLRRQVSAGMTAKQIQATWKPELDAFKKIRKKYLLYKDF